MTTAEHTEDIPLPRTAEEAIRACVRGRASDQAALARIADAVEVLTDRMAWIMVPWRIGAALVLGLMAAASIAALSAWMIGMAIRWGLSG